MGLSSSQARLLSLTARMHDIEYRAQRLEAQKLQLANESDKAYANYLRVLDAKKVQCKHLTSDGSITFIDATYQNLIERGYEITFKDFGYGLEHDVYENFVTATHGKTQFTEGNKEFFAALQTNSTIPTAGTDGLQTISPTKITGLDGTQMDVIEVYTSKQLANVLSSNQHNKAIRLMADIDMSGESSYNSIYLNNTIFDGNGHKITGLNKALFNNVDNSKICNLELQGNVVNGKGILSNELHTTNVTNVRVSGSVENHTTNGGNIGGLAGYVSNCTISHCAANVNVDASFVDDTQKGGSSVGGFVGTALWTNIDNSSSSGTVSGAICVGGFVGSVHNYWIKTDGSHNPLPASEQPAENNIKYTITNCSSNCNISVNSNGYPSGSTGNHPDSGAFAGIATKGNFENCVARGSITDYCGVSNDKDADDRNKPSVVTGFLGVAGGENRPTGYTVKGDTKIVNCDSYADVSSTWTVHICGFASNYSPFKLTIENCNYYGNLSTGDGSDDYTNSSFAFGARGELDVSNCYVQNSNNSDGTALQFVQKDSSANYGTGCQTTNNSSASSNSITVASPVIERTNNLPNDADKWRGVFADAAAAGGAVFDLSNQDPYGLSEHKNDNKWLSNLLTEGYIYVHVRDNDGEVHDVSVSIDTGLQEVDDERDLRKAEAQYEADMRQIDKKDRRYDTELAAVDAERNAVKQELDTLKNVAKDNVDRTFKLFS